MKFCHSLNGRETGTKKLHAARLGSLSTHPMQKVPAEKKLDYAMSPPTVGLEAVLCLR